MEGRAARPSGIGASASGPPVFIVGCPRSGTTLLRLMLDCHPDLAIPPESHFIPLLWSVRRRYRSDGRFDAERLARDIMATPRFREWMLPEPAVWRRVRALRRPGFAEVVEAVFLAYADHHGKRRWGDKTPGYSLEMALLGRLFGAARFLHVIRDGRDVALSFLESIGPKTLTEAAAAWAHRVRRGREDGRALGPGRYLEVRYEDLVEDAGAVLRTVCDFIELDFRPDMLRYHERGLRAVPVREHRVHRNLARPPTKGLRDWRRDMSPGDVALIEAVAGRELSAFGYERRYERLPGPARLRGRVGLAATTVSRIGWTVRRRARLTLKPDALPAPRRW